MGDQEQAKQLVDLALKFIDSGNKYVVGIELSGDPRVGDFGTFRGELVRAKESGVKISLHCAEVIEQAGENQAMIEFEPERLGHCCYLVNSISINKLKSIQSEQEIKQVVEKRIFVEICPSSNVSSTQSGVVSLLKHLNLF